MTKFYSEYTVINGGRAGGFGAGMFSNNQTVSTIDCSNTPWVNNCLANAFTNSQNLKTVTNLNDSIVNMDSAFYWCQNLTSFPVLPTHVEVMNYCFGGCLKVNGPLTIPPSIVHMKSAFYGCDAFNTPLDLSQCTRVTALRSTFMGTNLKTFTALPPNVEDLDQVFGECFNLVTLPHIPAKATQLTWAFYNCFNLTGNVYIHSENVVNCWWAFGNTTKNKDVYLPFKYSNGVYTATYNSFIAEGYSTSTRKQGVLMKDLATI